MTTSGGPPVPGLHVVTEDRVLARPDWAGLARAVLDAGGSSLALHLRGPGTPGRRLHALAVELSATSGGWGAWLMVNDRVDVALAAGATGAHLGARSIPVEAARAVMRPEQRLGASVHTPDEVARSSRLGVDYLIVGTVFATPSHPGLPGMGVNGLREAVGRAGGVPIIAIGGVGPERVDEVMEAGGAGIAVLRGIWDAGDPAAATERYVNALRGAS